ETTPPSPWLSSRPAKLVVFFAGDDTHTLVGQFWRAKAGHFGIAPKVRIRHAPLENAALAALWRFWSRALRRRTAYQAPNFPVARATFYL
ncbi:MAG: hypothetical protein ACE15E_24665, partial [Acidobacteriota bacterium]